MFTKWPFHFWPEFQWTKSRVKNVKCKGFSFTSWDFKRYLKTVIIHNIIYHSKRMSGIRGRHGYNNIWQVCTLQNYFRGVCLSLCIENVCKVPDLTPIYRLYFIILNTIVAACLEGLLQEPLALCVQKTNNKRFWILFFIQL